jgi:pyrophosphatase PpaX
LEKINYILFDLDGTLLNTNSLIIESFKHTLMEHLGMEVGEEELTPYFGEPLEVTLKRFSKEEAQAMLETYRSYNKLRHDIITTMFEGVEETLMELKKRGKHLAVVTSKKKETALRGLRLFDILKYFSVVMAMDDTEHHKPHPQPILRALEQLDYDGSGAIMVGDSGFDILCAKAAGIKGCSVEWSALPRQIWEEAKPDYIIGSMEDILAIVN